MDTNKLNISSNADDLIKLLNSIIPSVTGKVIRDALKQGAKAINATAKASLNASKLGKSTTNYKYYSTAFKIENIKNKNPLELGVKAGVKDDKNGYKLRWLEWGTADRYTKGDKGKPSMFRGKVEGSNFFYNSVKSNTEKAGKIISDALLKSLENLSK